MDNSNTAWLNEPATEEDYNDQGAVINFDDGEETDIECLECYVGTVYRFEETNELDDIRSVLICKNCGEQEIE